MKVGGRENATRFCALLLPMLLFSSFGMMAEAGQLDELLTRARQGSTSALADEQAREQRFITDGEQLRSRVEQARAELAALEAEARTRKTAIIETDRQLEQLRSEFSQQAGELSDTSSTVRQAARTLLTRLQGSLVSAQFPDRLIPLEAIGNTDGLPTIEQLQTLWLTLLQELVESGKISRFDTLLIGSDGRSSKRPVLRVGVFNAVSQAGFVSLEQQRLQLLPRQPDSKLVSIATAFFDRSGDSAGGTPQAMVIDPTRGEWLALLVQTPNRWERLQQGGSIGFLILGLGAAGLLLGLWRLLALALTARRMEWQLKQPQNPNANNPLGRVLASYAGPATDDQAQQDIEAQLHEAVLREIPRLSRGQTLLKLLAGVTPLLGLLGTVTGMIVTFQAISLFGTGDPRLMADGISQALMTTILGLGVAIPLLFLHSGVLSRGRALIQILDEESAGLIVRGQQAPWTGKPDAPGVTANA